MMLDFSLTAEQALLRQKARAFAREVLRPVARHYDETGEWPGPVLQAARDAGFMQASIPTEFGGQGLSRLEETLIFEELAWGCAGLFTTISANSLGAAPILIAGSPEQKRRWLPFLAERGLAAFALSEPGAGSDAGAVACRAERRGDGYLLNGTKCYCTSGAHADLVCLFATTQPGRGTRGISAFLVERGTPGFTAGKAMDKLGHRASEQVDLHFENAFIPAANLLGQEGQGFSIAMRTLDQTRSLVAAAGLGVGRAAMEEALAHAKSRVQFGQPIIAQQAIAFMLADMAASLDAARLLTWRAAWMADQGMGNSMESAMAKTMATDAAMAAATNTVQILGGQGYSREHLAEKLFRDAKLLQIYEGTNQIQRMIIAKGLQQQG